MYFSYNLSGGKEENKKTMTDEQMYSQLFHVLQILHVFSVKQLVKTVMRKLKSQPLSLQLECVCYILTFGKMNNNTYHCTISLFVKVKLSENAEAACREAQHCCLCWKKEDYLVQLVICT